MILITGATGQLGESVVDFLINKISPSDIAVLARNSEKSAGLKDKGVDVRIGDYNDYESLEKAFTGVKKLFFVSGNDIPNRSPQHKNVVEAARKAGVEHILYTSFQRKTNDATSPIEMVAKTHIETETWLIESGMNYTLLRHNLYTDGIPMFLGEKVLETGQVFLPAGEGKAAYATRKDMAEAGANLLASEGHENNIYEISNTESVSYRDIAGILSEISGKEIEYVSPTTDVFKDELAKAGVPEMQINFAAGFAEAIKEGEFDFPDTRLEGILGRKPTSVKEFLFGYFGK